MAAPNIPQPVYANGGGGGGGNFLSQLLLTIAAQGPDMLMGHLARKDQERRDMALGAASLPAIEQLNVAAQQDPSLAALGAAVNAFLTTPDAKVMQLAAPAFLEQAQGTMTTLSQRKLTDAQAGQATAQTTFIDTQSEMARNADAREAELQPHRVEEARASAGIQAIEEQYRAQLLEAQIAREKAMTAASWRDAERIDQETSLRRIELAAQLEAYERDAYNAAIETNMALTGDAAMARRAAALAVYGTPRAPSLAEVRADAQTRAAGGEPNLFQSIRGSYVQRMRAAGYGATLPDDVLTRFLDQLDLTLLERGGDAQAAMDAIVAAGTLGPDELPVAANYLSAVSARPVRVNAPKVPLSERLRKFFGEAMTPAGEARQRERPAPRGFDNVLNDLGLKPPPPKR